MPEPETRRSERAGLRSRQPTARNVGQIVRRAYWQAHIRFSRNAKHASQYAKLPVRAERKLRIAAALKAAFAQFVAVERPTHFAGAQSATCSRLERAVTMRCIMAMNRF